MGMSKLINLIYQRWYIPVFAIALGLVAHLGFEAYLGPAREVAVAEVEVRLGALTEFPRVQSLIEGMTQPDEEDRKALAELSAEFIEGQRKVRVPLDPSSNQVDLQDALRDFASDFSTLDKKIHFEELSQNSEIQIIDSDQVQVKVEASNPKFSRLQAWLLAEAFAWKFENEILQVSKDVLASLKKREQELEAEWKEAIQKRLEFSRGIGVVDLDRQEQLVQRMILEIDEEISRIEIERLELARWINDLHVAQASAEEEKEARTMLKEQTIEELRDDLLQARLEYQVNSLTKSTRHPQMARLQRKILDLESQLETQGEGLDEESSAEPEQTKDAKDDALINKYRMLSLRLDTLQKKREGHAREYQHINEVRPDLSKVQTRVELASQRLEPVRKSIANVEWFQSHSGELIHITPPEESQPVTQAGRGVYWRTVWGIAGGCLGILILLFMGLLDTTLRSEKSVAGLLGLPILAKIPAMSKAVRYDPEATDKKGKRLSKRGVREGFNTMATVMRTVGRELGLKTFSIASARSGEGKTTSVIHLAVALAKKGMRVAVVDANTKNPCLHHLLGLDNGAGLADLVESGCVVSEVDRGGKVMEEVVEISSEHPDVLLPYLQTAFYENLYVLPVGQVNENTEAALSGQVMRSILDSLALSMDVVLIDTPPVDQEGEALELVGLSDCCLMVIRSGMCKQHEALRAKHLFENVQTSVLGVVLNCYRGEIEFASTPAQKSEPVVEVS